MSIRLEQKDFTVKVNYERVRWLTLLIFNGPESSHHYTTDCAGSTGSSFAALMQQLQHIKTKTSAAVMITVTKALWNTVLSQ